MELTTDDVEAFTQGRLSSSDDETQRMLDAALVTARRYVGWHVSPVREDDEIIIDGPNSRILNLPTRKLVELSSITEAGTELDLAKLAWSAGGPPGLLERPVSVRKRAKTYWSGDYQDIDVVMTHGYTEEEAADWRYAILDMVTQMASSTGHTDAGLTSKKVDDVTYSWGLTAQDALFTVTNILDDYTLPRLEFL